MTTPVQFGGFRRWAAVSLIAVAGAGVANHYNGWVDVPKLPVAGDLFEKEQTDGVVQINGEQKPVQEIIRQFQSNPAIQNLISATRISCELNNTPTRILSRDEVREAQKEFELFLEQHAAGLLEDNPDNIPLNVLFEEWPKETQDEFIALAVKVTAGVSFENCRL